LLHEPQQTTERLAVRQFRIARLPPRSRKAAPAPEPSPVVSAQALPSQSYPLVVERIRYFSEIILLDSLQDVLALLRDEIKDHCASKGPCTFFSGTAMRMP